LSGKSQSQQKNDEQLELEIPSETEPPQNSHGKSFKTSGFIVNEYSIPTPYAHPWDEVNMFFGFYYFFW